jgi:hypothetical protein
MATDYNYFYTQFQAIVDSINHDSDLHQRLSNLQRLNVDMRRVIIDSRDDAAYELRSRYSSQDAEAISKISRKYIDYWAKRWMRKNYLPPLKQRKRIDLSNVLDLSGE